MAIEDEMPLHCIMASAPAKEIEAKELYMQAKALIMHKDRVGLSAFFFLLYGRDLNTITPQLPRKIS